MPPNALLLWALTSMRMLRRPAALVDLIETYGFAWNDLERALADLKPVNAYRRFIAVIANNREQPAWWVESRAEPSSTPQVTARRVLRLNLTCG